MIQGVETSCDGSQDAAQGEVWDVPVKDILTLWDPFAAWGWRNVTIEEVERALRLGHLEPRPFDTLSIFAHREDEEALLYHAERIAWLVVHKDDTPIVIDIGAPSLGWHPRRFPFDFIDGNHRLCAASIREDETIRVTYDGECDAFPILFPGATYAGDQAMVDTSEGRD